jgi:hypothetical protein
MQPCILDNSVVAAAEVTTLLTAPIPCGMVFKAYSVAALDEDTAIATRIEIGVRDGTKDIPIDSTPGNFPAATSMTLYWPCVLREGQRVYAKFVTPTAGDHLRVIAHGVLEECIDNEA